jgi:regulatory protein
LEHELRAKGIDRQIIADAVDDAGIDELAGAMAVAESKMRSYGGLDPAVARRRLSGLLARRGYGYDVVKPVLERLFGVNPDNEQTGNRRV